jgi:DNA-binding NarL/FixJ family response regulator
MKTIAVGLVDDHVLLRKGLGSMLSDHGYRVVLQSNNGKLFIDGLDETNLPDVVLLDINMPVMDGYQTAQWLKNNYPDIRILALSMYDDDQAIIRMLHCGAHGYILKDCEPEELTTAIDSVYNKGFYHSELVSNRLIHSMHGANPQDPLPQLNVKELQFLELNCSEMTYKEIASVMHLSPRTIDGYRDVLFEKLGIRSRVGLVIYAIKHRLVQL